MKPRRLAVACLLVAVIGCTSCAQYRRFERVSPFDRAPLYGMVYDRDNAPCAGATIVVDDRKRAAADHDGRFVLSSVKPGLHRVRLTKRGYVPLEIEIDFQDPSQVLYARMTSLAQLLAEAENAISRREWLEAKKALARASAIEESDLTVRFLTAVLAVKRGEYEEAERRLRDLINSTPEDHPPVLYLLLADIYEHHLSRPTLAVDALEHYLQDIEDPEARSRLERLKSETTPG